MHLMSKAVATGITVGLLFTSVQVADAAPAKKVETKSIKKESKIDEVSSLQDINKKKPYFIYNGYFKPSSKLVLDKAFVNALNYDNFSINGQEVGKNRLKPNEPIPKSLASIKDIYVYPSFERVVGISLPIKEKTITKVAFTKAHKPNKLVRKESNGTVLVYKTKANTYYQANFDKKGYLQSVTIL